MIDDDDDKARRNVVVASAVLLLGSWLIPVPSTLLERAASFAGERTIEPFRAWSAAAAVMLYLLYRFGFAPSTRRAWEELVDEYRQLRQALVIRMVTRRADRHVRRRQASRWLASDFLRAIHNIRQGEDSDLEMTPRNLVVIPEGAWFGRIRTELNGHFFDAEGWELNWSADEKEAMHYDVPKRGRIWIRMQASLHLMVWSRSCSALLLPVLLGCWALLLACYRLLATV